MSKCHIVGNHMPWLNFSSHAFFLLTIRLVYTFIQLLHLFTCIYLYLFTCIYICTETMQFCAMGVFCAIFSLVFFVYLNCDFYDYIPVMVFVPAFIHRTFPRTKFYKPSTVKPVISGHSKIKQRLLRQMVA